MSGSTLKYLNSVSLAYSDTRGGMSIDMVIQYLEAPTLRRAEIFMMSISSFYNVLGKDKVYNLTDLRLDQCVVSENALRELLHLFPNLKSFHYHRGGWCSCRGNPLLISSLRSLIKRFRNCNG